ncbi:hypothetical protein SPRG_14616 [Saprolegnia parasitica CBS 223.65]|uniref:F-box domain-containing protein n=1 Tax=Saprolegnia parasitica (strain CBS 223.65) TaxID=695850 RepID=A0A067C011_SAPPC|nr:hypothetical protein SPRG_14616 [Saprolegnia parasitica CBS 223.65]KDO20137.1 hypothetical protein SPRG_14616 [Saprolegnia parasitica CBS 223.65]|eukprot:XP_012209178.1 hypothetical protein SPRG_14616 [Saprolegnia parasitica CBS 223.65]
MADSGRRTKVARPTPPDALALPHVVEVIAMCLGNQKDFSSFLHALPRSLWTAALTAFLDSTTVMPSSVIANWPHIVLRDMDLPPSVLALLAATLPLRPRIEVLYVIRDAAPLTLLVAAVGPALNTSNAVELNGLLAVVAHPHDLSIDLQGVTTTPRLGHRLAAWLSTTPTTKLRLTYVDQMNHDGAIAFCDALQASTTLQELAIVNVRSLGGFHGQPATLQR